MIENSKIFACKAASLAVIIICVLLSGCKTTAKVEVDDPKPFYGNWQNVRGSTTMKVTITKESWTGKSEAGDYILELLSWTPVANDDPKTNGDYPKGYYVTGTASQVNKIGDLKNGQTQTFTIFMNKDKTAILRKSSNAADLYPSAVFTKTE